MDLLVVLLVAVIIAAFIVFVIFGAHRALQTSSSQHHIKIDSMHVHYHESSNKEQVKTEEGTEDDTDSINFSAREEATVQYEERTVVKDGTTLLRNRNVQRQEPGTTPPPYPGPPLQPSGERTVVKDGRTLWQNRNMRRQEPGTPPPPYPGPPLQPSDIYHHKDGKPQVRPKAFLETLDKTVPKDLLLLHQHEVIYTTKGNSIEDESATRNECCELDCGEREPENSVNISAHCGEAAPNGQQTEAESVPAEDDQVPEHVSSPMQESTDFENAPTPVEEEVLEKEEIVVRVIKVESPDETFGFDVDKNGCSVVSPYCKLHFPPDATKHLRHIKMTPNYKSYAIEENQIPICASVDFVSDDEMIFDRKVTVSLHTNYTAIGDKKVPVQVVWRKECESLFEICQDDLLHGNERFISFDVKHFCGYSVVADESQFLNMQRHYCSAVYMRRPKNEATRYLHWLIYEDCPSVIAEQDKYLFARDTVIDPEKFALRYNHNLQLSFNGGDISIRGNDQTSGLAEKWGLRVSESFQFKVTKQVHHQGSDSEVQYDISARHARTRAPYPIMQKGFFLEWERKASAPSVNINVSGRGAVGMSHNYGTPCERDLERQTSNISDASSGYSSALPTPSIQGQSFASLTGESIIVEQTQVEDQDDSMLDVEEAPSGPATIPKLESGNFDSFTSSPPLSQSTPLPPRAQTQPKEKEESKASSDKSFAS